MAEGHGRASALSLFPVSHETARRLDLYIALLEKWQRTTNLVAPSTLGQVWTRHVADSLQLLVLAPGARVWLDIGSGGGFPGIVLACALADVPEAHIHLVERNGKKVAFLREALRVTGAPGTVHHGDIADCRDDISPHIDRITARAVAPLAELVTFAEPWLNLNSKALFLKGLDVGLELADTTLSSRFDIQLHPSMTGNGKIVELARSGLPE